MQIETSPTAEQRKSPFLAALAIIFASMGAYAWVQTGQAPHLLGALAFAAMVPVWYLLPISFNESMQEQWKRRASYHLPKWAQVLTWVSLFLLFASVGLRWSA